MKSILVGVVHLILSLIYVIDGSPNDMNIGFWLYTPIGIFLLWPYQLVLVARLRKREGDLSKYLGVGLSVVSLILTVGIW